MKFLRPFLLFQATASNASDSINELPYILITKALPIISGIIIFVIGQIALELYIKPLKRYKEIKSEIVKALVFYANIYYNPVPVSSTVMKSEREEAQKELRKLAGELNGFTEERSYYKGPGDEKIKKASSCLIGLSNSLESVHPELDIEHNEKRVKELKELLNLSYID